MVSVVGVNLSSWQEQGECFGTQLFPENNRLAAEFIEELCSNCEVRDQCLQLGLEMMDVVEGLSGMYGVWGGVWFGGTSGYSRRTRRQVNADIQRGYTIPSSIGANRRTVLSSDKKCTVDKCWRKGVKYPSGRRGDYCYLHRDGQE